MSVFRSLRVSGRGSSLAVLGSAEGRTSWSDPHRQSFPALHRYTYSLNHPPSHLLTLSLTHSLTYSLTHSLTHSPAHSPLNHSLTHSLTHSFTHSLTHPLTHSLTHSLIHIEESFHKLQTATVPEMQRSNLAPVILQLKALGVDNVLRFHFLSVSPHNIFTSLKNKA